MLDLINVRKTFNKGTINQRVALDGINLHLDDGDFVTVIGGNGAGKSTMLNAVAGVWPVDDGRIILDRLQARKVYRPRVPRPHDGHSAEHAA